MNRKVKSPIRVTLTAHSRPLKETIMIHEPECINYDGGHLCVCDILSAAYTRGYENALAPVTKLIEEWNRVRAYKVVREELMRAVGIAEQTGAGVVDE